MYVVSHLRDVIHRKHKDKKVRPASATQWGFSTSVSGRPFC